MTILYNGERIEVEPGCILVINGGSIRIAPDPDFYFAPQQLSSDAEIKAAFGPECFPELRPIVPAGSPAKKKATIKVKGGRKK